MNRYQSLFGNLKNQSRGALVPFLMLGEPDINQCLQWVDMLIGNGADALELGMPFSDPVADGPVIQLSSIAVLKNNTSVDDCFEMISRIREKHPTIPMGLLTYANLLVARGLEKFYQDCAKAGLDSVLMADIPAHAIAPFAKAAVDNQILPILIAPPNAAEQQLEAIARKSQGYTYVVSRAGVTGDNKAAGIPRDIIKQLAELGAPPSLLGFGISTTEDVANAIDAGCSGAICGSALVKIQQQYQGEQRLAEGAKLMSQLTKGLSKS